MHNTPVRSTWHTLVDLDADDLDADDNVDS